jgi:hypothetical protein
MNRKKKEKEEDEEAVHGGTRFGPRLSASERAR